MTKQEALAILNCSQLNEVRDSFDEILFDYKSKFLQQIPHFKVIKSILKKIKRINTAYSVFYSNTSSKNEELECDLNETSLALFLDEYQLLLSQIRLRIANCDTGESLIMSIQNLVECQTNLIIKLSSIANINTADLDKYPIKLSEEINVHKIQLELNTMQIDDTKISEYIRSQIEKLDFEKFAYITIAVINAEKQMIFNELRVRK